MNKEGLREILFFQINFPSLEKGPGEIYSINFPSLEKRGQGRFYPFKFPFLPLLQRGKKEKNPDLPKEICMLPPIIPDNMIHREY
ncbi:MAG TPA: hypothetical protein PLF61_00065, partial [Candidatus Goldiibacteriota bacterium]|nr:hypothetical protein [Candidatus Goldiibacteriota bacterium]